MANTAKIKVIFIESEANTRLRIEQALASQNDIHVIGFAASRRQAEQLLSQFKFQMLVADLSMPDGFGLELIRQTAAKHSDVDIMVLADSRICIRGNLKLKTILSIPSDF